MTQLKSRGLDGVRAAVTRARVLLVVKTAAAAAIAWSVAPLMPGVTDEYPYFAPLGAVISMHPTVLQSVRSGLQTLAGLAAGIGLALAVVFTVGPNWWSVPTVVAAGVLLAGTGWFGAGREYVPIAALFVLIIGGTDAEDYSLGYLTQMGVGVAVGIVITLILPPRPFAASGQIAQLRDALAERLEQIAGALNERWPPAEDDWAREVGALEESARQVRQALLEADFSRKGNPRALLRRWRRAGSAFDRLQTLEAVAVCIREISVVLADTMWPQPHSLTLDDSLTGPLADACGAVADALRAEGEDARVRHGQRADALAQVRRLVERLDEDSAATGRSLGPAALVAAQLRRIIIALGADR